MSTLDALNDRISEGMFIDKDIWVMGFNPEDEPSDFVADVTFNYEVDDEYSHDFCSETFKVAGSCKQVGQKGIL